MARNKIEDLRNLLFEQIEKLMDDDADVDKETAKAKAISKLADTIIHSAKVEIDFLKMMGTEGTGTGFIPVENKKQIG